MVQAYLDDEHVRSIDILSTRDVLNDDILSIGTIGLSETALIAPDGTEFATRVELCAYAPAAELHWPNAVASAAFHIVKGTLAVAPGEVIANVLLDYIPDTAMPHFYLKVPFAWNEASFPELALPSLRINWLQCVAIHESERKFIEEWGSAAFEDLLCRHRVNTLDGCRPTVAAN